MRLLMGEKRAPEAKRKPRRRQAPWRAIGASAVALVLVVTVTGGAYLARIGTIADTIATIQARLIAESATLHLTVQSVEVEGRHRAARQALLDALQVRRGTPILGIDLDAAKARLESIPWVRSAAVERQLPDTIYVRLVERTPLAVWQHQKRFDVIDQDGNIIPNVRVEDFASLPQVVGDGAPEATGELIEMLHSEPALAAHVTAAVRIGERRWNLDLDNGIEVAMPEESTEAAWHRLAALDRSDHLLERDIKFVDLRLQDRIVIRLSPETAKTFIKKPRPVRPNA